MKIHELIQGDSYSYNFTSSSVTTFDTDWTGTWAVVDALGAGRNTVATGSLTISTDETKLEMRITPADSTVIAEGSYFLCVQVTNAVIGFNKEIMQDKIVIKPQGI